jgi:hypothetical protein
MRIPKAKPTNVKKAEAKAALFEAYSTATEYCRNHCQIAPIADINNLLGHDDVCRANIRERDLRMNILESLFAASATK